MKCLGRTTLQAHSAEVVIAPISSPVLHYDYAEQAPETVADTKKAAEAAFISVFGAEERT